MHHDDEVEKNLIKQAHVNGFQSSKVDPNEWLYKDSLTTNGLSLKTSASISMLPNDYF